MMARFSIAQLSGEKRAGKLATHLCPVCGERKALREFRQSNQNPKRNTICWRCRHEFDGVETQFWSGKLRQGLVTKTQIGQFDERAPRRLKQNFRPVCRLLTRLKTRRISRGKGVLWMPKDKSIQLLRLPEKIAAVIGKTYAVRGDDATLADDEALLRIRDLLEEYDASIVERNKNKRLNRG